MSDPPETAPAAAPETLERQWLEQTYNGNQQPELTGRAFLASVFLGGLMIAFNLYMGLKVGLRYGGSIVAVIIAFAVFKALRRPLSPLENNLAQTAASAAGSLGSVVNVVPAMLLLAADGVLTRPVGFADVFLYVGLTSFLGVLFAVPLRRQAIVIDRLTFPTGVAAAQTIRAMHDRGAEAIARARALGVAGMLAGAVTWLRDGVGAFIPSAVLAPSWLELRAGVSAASLQIGAAVSPLMLGVGFIVGPRVAISMVAAGFVGWGLVGPWLIDNGTLASIAASMTPLDVVDQCRAALAASPPTEEQLAFAHASCRYMVRLQAGSYYSILVKWLMWPGLGLMVAGGLTATAARWRMMFRAVRSLFGRAEGASPIADLELPRRTWLVALGSSTVAVLLVLQLRFGVAWYLGLLAIGLAFLLSVIAVRATGETDLNPTGPMGSITQIGFGSLQAGLGATGAHAVTGNLLAGGVSASAASEASDMMQDLKTGWLLGATPRRQVYAQLLGVTVGAVFSVPILWALLDAYELGTSDLPAPAGVTWSGLATMMTRGTAALPTGAVGGLAAGAAIGVLAAAVEAAWPEIARRFLPSAVGMGVALIVPFLYSFTIFLGALLLVVIRSRRPAWIAAYGVALGAGAIAGEGLAGILAALARVVAA